MNRTRKGANAVLSALAESGIDTCFSNPGTSEMHLVAAFDEEPRVRPVLVLFEGVATGAADGFARMAGRPASTLLHLGPGMANGLANVHNARKAGVGMLNLVGDQATFHRATAAPLVSDIEGLGRPLSDWIRVASTPYEAAILAGEAARVARGNEISTLVLPADTTWQSTSVAPLCPPEQVETLDVDVIEAVARALRASERSMLLVNGSALTGEALEAAARIAKTSGSLLYTDTLVTRWGRGAGSPKVERFPFLAGQAIELMGSIDHLVLVETDAPVAAFAQPDTQAVFTSPDCRVQQLVHPGRDSTQALLALSAALGAESEVMDSYPRIEVEAPHGRLSAAALGQSIAAWLPEQAIVVDEGITEGATVAPATAGAAPHDWLMNRGGAIGLAIPQATGAALACPDRPVLCLTGDGSALYTLQALWTQARESLDVTTIVLANRSYRILGFELSRMGAKSEGERSRSMLDLRNPDIDFCSVAKGFGVPAHRAETAQELSAALRTSMEEPGPHLIEAVIAS